MKLSFIAGLLWACALAGLWGCAGTRGGLVQDPDPVPEAELREAAVIDGEDVFADASASPDEGIVPARRRSAGSLIEDVAAVDSGVEDVGAEQELLDAALGFCEASQEYWSQGRLDEAVEALDQAYALILQVRNDHSPEVMQQREDLRYTISKRILEIHASRFTAVNGNHEAIPLVMNEHVEHEIRLFQGRERNFFLEAYKRSGRYRAAISEALREAGLPEEISWLPLIESGFKVKALSRARALGLWQFIPSTGYKFGLNRDDWIDERMDPEKSTGAAIAYLQELHDIFGDWTTCLAAYNCGEGAVLRVIRQQRLNYLDNFWDLYTRLPRETARYVPRFLATLHIIRDPARYGFTLDELDDPLPFEVVTVDRQMQLKVLARELRLDDEEILALNPELRRGVTPPAAYGLRVPPGMGEVLLAKMDSIGGWEPPPKAFVYHRVKRGESLSRIAARYRTSIQAIVMANNLRQRNVIRAGQTLKVPFAGNKVPAVAASAREDLPPGGEYVVRKGDSLWLIARKFNTDTKTLLRHNRLSSTRLHVGQVLKIRQEGRAARAEGGELYRVRKGDSPCRIARKCDVSLSTLLRINGLTSDSVIHPGQVLIIRQ